MRLPLIILTLLIASPASAHCYTVWRYKTPQHCGVVRPVQVAHYVAPRPVARAIPSLPVPMINDWTLAVDKLKRAMKEQTK